MKRSAAVQIIVALLVSALVRPQVGVAATAPIALTQVVLAASGPRVAVFVVPLDLSAAQQQGALEGAAEAALEKTGRFVVSPVQDAFNPGAAKKHADLVDAAREKLKSGKQAIDELDNVKATADFKAALEALQQADLTREFPALLDAWTMKAAGHATGGENGPAKKDMEAVVALSPRAEFSPTFFPPDLIKFAEAQRKQATNAKGELLVRTEPAGARVWVDGQYRGVSPVTIAGLTSAKHFVTASLGGYSLGQSLASPGETQLDLEISELSTDWKTALLDIKRSPDSAIRDSSAATFGKAAQLEQVVLVIAKKSTAGEQLELTALRLESRDGHNASYRTATLNAGDPEALSGFFDGIAAQDDKRDGKDPVHHYPGSEGLDTRKIASYSLMGGGAAFLIVGVVLGVMASVNYGQFLTTPQPQVGPSRSLSDPGKAFALGADISYIVGLAAGVTGAVLFFTKPADTSSSAAADADKKTADDAKKREAEKQAADDRDAAEAREKSDKKAKEDEKKKEDDARAAEEKKKKDDEAAAAAKKDDDAKKLSKKEQAALEKKEREEAAAKKREEEKAAAEEEKKKKDEEKKASKGQTKKEKEAAERKAKEEEEARLKAEEEAKAKEAAEKKKADEDARKRREAEEKKKKDEDHDDLRNY